MGETMYVKANATQLVEEVKPDEKNLKHALLWGDAVTDAVDKGDGTHVVGTGHAHRGLVPKKHLQTTPLALLELYVIDVGQGDAILFRSPDGAWHLIDGGPPRGDSLLGEGARNFLAWKFGADLGLKTVPLRTVFLSHSDEDHFGGLTEILRSEYPPNPETGENRLTTTVEHFLHAGVAKYDDEEVGLGVVGETLPAERLLDGRKSFAKPPFPLADRFGDFANALGNVTNAAGDAPNIRRVTHKNTVPDYGPGTGRPFSMHLLGPIPENEAGDLRSFDDTSHTVNGHSVVVRLDYEKMRILLTGDINAVAQRHLLDHVDAAEFKADVLKACHHGAEDIDSEFTKAVAARVSVVSSGDNEDYSHPRPSALGGYAYYGRRSFQTKTLTETRVQPPLIYGTEIARSIKTKSVTVDGHQETAIDEVTFGLVNVRTDGRKIICAVRDEVRDRFDVEELWVDADDKPTQDPPRDG
jgi:beta-lactamase superfamily II metal-dependent hydrolase